MLSIILITLLDVFNDCEIIFFSVEEGNCVMDAEIDLTGEIEFFDGGVKFDVIWFRELIDLDIVDSSVFDIVWVDIYWVKVDVCFDAGKFSPADVAASILHLRHLKKRLQLFFLSSVLWIFLNSLCLWDLCIWGLPKACRNCNWSNLFFHCLFSCFFNRCLVERLMI